MYKFMQMRPEKKKQKSSAEEGQTTAIDDDDSDAEDPELEKFANDEMDREMKRMASGAPGGMPDSEDEEVTPDEDEDGESGGFFSGEDDLQEVKMSDDDQDDEDESEGEDLMSEGSNSDEVLDDESDGDEIDDDDGSDLPSEELTSKQKAKNAKKKRGRNSDFFEADGGKNLKQTQSGTKYASYEDFAHLLEEDLADDEVEKPKKKKQFTSVNYAAQKRKRTK